MNFARRVNWLKRSCWRIAGCRSRVAGSSVMLTFDDGPHPEHTPAVLDRLAEHGITAAFFLVGNRISDPSLVERISAAGHILGNHTFSHPVLRWSDSALSLTEVGKCQELIPNAKMFRPPLGRLTPGLWFAARQHGLRIVNWSLDSGDWRCQTADDAARCGMEVLKLVRPGDVLLFHDNHRWIVPILEVVLPELANAYTRVIPRGAGCGGAFG